MNRRNWRRVLAILCLAGCLVCRDGFDRPLARAEQKSAGEAGQDSADGEGKQGMSDAGGMAGFVIDNQNIYEGMDKSYARGYVPKVGRKKAVVVLPLLAKRKIAQNRLTAAVRFGETDPSPFVRKNYEKAVAFANHPTGRSGQTMGCYLVSFQLELKKERYNGSYPVMFSVSAEDEAGNEINQEFTVYVTIADGKEAGGEGSQGISDTGGMTGFAIDSRHVYKGMRKSYAQGYVPGIEGKKAVIVLPLLAKHKLAGNKATVTLKFGETENLPFVRKNYEKAVALGAHKTGEGNKKQECYLVTFSLKLKEERYNGSYPVTLAVAAQDGNGNEINQEFTVYVTITDGKDPAADGAAPGADNSLPQFAPKVMVHTYKFSKKKVLCGRETTAKVTLLNTSKTEPVKNMLVTVAPDENVELLDKTGSSYVGELGPDSTCDISFKFRARAAVPSGQYNINITMDYADSKGNPITAQGTVKVSARQQVQIEIAPVHVPKELQLGETVELQVQAMNLGKGKLYHVRANMEADGLTPSGTAFIGDMEAGTSMSGSMELTAEGLDGDSLFGATQGKITFYYEDEGGNELTQEQAFETSIVSPLSGEGEDQTEDDTRQWWIIMTVILIVLVQAAVIFFMRRPRRAHRGEVDYNEK